MVTNKKSQNQITAAVFIFLTFFIYGMSVGEMNDGENSIAFEKSGSLTARGPASVD